MPPSVRPSAPPREGRGGVRDSNQCQDDYADYAIVLAANRRARDGILHAWNAYCIFRIYSDVHNGAKIHYAPGLPFDCTHNVHAVKGFTSMTHQVRVWTS